MVKFIKPAFLISFLFLFFTTIAQDVKLEWSEEFQTKDYDEYPPTLIGIIDNYLYSYISNNDEIIFIKFDKSSLTKSETFKIPLKVKNSKSRKVVHTKILNGKIYIFTSEYNKSDDNYYFYGSLINMNGEIEIEDKLIDNYKANNLGNDLTISLDSTKFIISNKLYYSRKNGNVRIGYKIFNFKNLELISNVSSTTPFMDKLVSIKSIMMDKNNDVWINASIRDQNIQNHYSRILYSKEGNYEKTDEIYFENKSTNENQIFHINCSFSFDDNDNVLCYGNYGDINKKRTSNCKGIFVLKIDKETKKIITKEYKGFDIEQVKNASGSFAVKQDKGITDIKFKCEVKNGKYTYMISEVEYPYESSTTISSYGNIRETISNKTNYFNNNIFITKTREDGSIEWIKTINKYQMVASTDENNSFVNNKSIPLKFIYLDDPSKFENKSNTDFNNTKKKYTLSHPSVSTITYAEIGENGEVKISPLINTKDVEKFKLIPYNKIQVNDNEIIMIASKDKNFKLLKIQF